MRDERTLQIAGPDGSLGELRRARISVSLIFLIHGILVSNWLSRIPAMQARLHLSVGMLGATLLAAAAGALIAMPLTSMLVGRFGSARVTRVSTLGLCACLALPGLAWNVPALAAALFAYGAAAGLMDVAMNTEGVAVEAAYGRPVMVGFHAQFSLGGMIGSLMGSLAAGRAMEPQWHLAAVGGALAAASIPVCRHLLVNVPQPLPDTSSTRELLRPLIGLGVVAFCVLLGEGAMADWSAVYLGQLSGPGLAPGLRRLFAVDGIGKAAWRLVPRTPRLRRHSAVGRGAGGCRPDHRAAGGRRSRHAGRLRLRGMGLLRDLSYPVLGGGPEGGGQAAGRNRRRLRHRLSRLPGPGRVAANGAAAGGRAQRTGVGDGWHRAQRLASP